MPAQSGTTIPLTVRFLSVQGFVRFCGLVSLCALHGVAWAQPARVNSNDARRLQTADPGAAKLAQLPHETLATAAASDATLHSIAIITEDRLCAVGDRGAVLTTEDAGRQWKLMPPVTTSNLHGVAFAGDLGLAVGGSIGNAIGMSRGVVLRSTNGGRAWQVLSTPQLSRLTGIAHLNGRWTAWGDFSPEMGSSVFESIDDGRTWQPAAVKIGHCVAAGISTVGDLAAIDMLGRTAFRENARGESIIGSMRAIVHTGQRWLACGDSGQLLSTVNGSQWIRIQLPLSDAARQVMDLRSINRTGLDDSQWWICGSPGSLLLHSSDRGSSWRTVKTGQSLPLHDVAFLDENRGWAVGASGVILATRDGGNSWYAQRKHTPRVGLLSVATHIDHVPWCPLVAAAWDNQVSVASIVTTPEESLALADIVPSRATQLSAIAPLVGLAQQTTWTKDWIPSSADVGNTESLSQELLTRKLAIELLSWRPDIVLSDEQTPLDLYQWPKRSATETQLPLAAAIALAADTSQLPVAAELGLPSWQVFKWVCVCDARTAQFSEQSQRLLSQPGLAIWDILLPLPQVDRVRSVSTPMRTVWANSQATVVHASLLGGSQRTSANGRELSLATLGNYQLVMGRVHRHKSLSALTERTAEPLERWLADLDLVLAGFPDSELAPALLEFSRQLAEVGSWDRHRIALQQLIRRSPSEDAADWSRLELLRLSSSDEFAAWQTSQATKSPRVGEIESVSPAPSATVSQATWNATPFDVEHASPTKKQNPGVITASAYSPAELESNTATIAKSSIRPGKADATAGGRQPTLSPEQWFVMFNQAASVSPRLASRVDMQVLQASNMRRAGNLVAHSQQLQQANESAMAVGWGQVTRQELQLANRQAEQAKWLAFASRTSRPPVLDGQLLESCWQAAPAMRLSPLPSASTPDERSATMVAWAFDTDYLYVAIDSSRNPARPAMALAAERHYDADLSELDHVQLILDTDRDYNSAVEYSIAENGWTAERCCGFTSYNPPWHACVRPGAEHWVAEIAIPLSSLTASPSIAGTAWAISARRIIPDGEPQSWSQLRSHRPFLQGGGLLLFAPDSLVAE